MTKIVRKRCMVCDSALEKYAAYLPGKGEVCMDCYRKAATSDNAVLMKTRRS